MAQLNVNASDLLGLMSPLLIDLVPDEAQQFFDNAYHVLNVVVLGLSVLLSMVAWLRESRSAARAGEAHATSIENTQLAEHHLQMVQQQIGQLFGPLKGLMTANKQAMVSALRSLKQKRLKSREELYLDVACTMPNPDFRWFAYDASGEPVAQNVEVVIEWRRWVRTVLQPCNEEMLNIMVGHTHLLPRLSQDADGCLPVAFTDAMEHFLSYRVLLDAWDKEEARSADGRPTGLRSFENTATVQFPKALPLYIDDCWAVLLEERDELMNLTRPVINSPDRAADTDHRESGARPRLSYVGGGGGEGARKSSASRPHDGLSRKATMAPRMIRMWKARKSSEVPGECSPSRTSVAGIALAAASLRLSAPTSAANDGGVGAGAAGGAGGGGGLFLGGLAGKTTHCQAPGNRPARNGAMGLKATSAHRPQDKFRPMKL